MPKANAATTKPSAKKNTKTQSKPEQKKVQSKADPKKGGKTATKATGEKKTVRKNLNQCVGFVYAGSMIKASHVYLFECDNSDPVTYVRENLVPYFGIEVNGRYVKCADAEETMKAVLADSAEKGYQCDAECQNILKCNIGDASSLIKDAAAANTAHTLTLVDQNNKPKKAGKVKADTKGGKGSKKASKDDEDAEDEQEEDNEDDSENGSDDDVENDEDDVSDEQDDEEEEEEEKPKGKGAQKGGKAAPQTKGKGAAAKRGK